MYWIRLAPLKRDLAGPGLTERQRFAYVLATALASALGALGQDGPPDIRVYGARIAVIFLTFLTVWNAYRCNGGRNGTAFLDRFFSLGWVISLRTGIVVFIAQNIVPYALTMVGFAGPDDDASPTSLSLGLTLLGVTYIAWVLGYHIRDVAGAAIPSPVAAAAHGAQRLERFVESVALREAAGASPIVAGATTRRPRRSSVTVVRRRKR